MSDHKASHVSKWLAVLLLLSLLITLLPAGVAGAAFKRCDKLYKVKRGDTLASIALQVCIRTARKTFYWQCASVR